ncbi:Asp23/Gls24 family envelope stress response protein [Paenibacillus sp. S150]|uniref:Asp23/Gls24 family envelope stress response protein n=1 Tax=Paenibacillus sp. S150 TaxID=2749826 RepID=UPI001C577E44|nr:Asp23/Gls24 family envelope stress response protein [Paenibacillus sp. S150]MBW4081341.1 Asp23/Gls24 family envelope stress response protein [Paenibacillus sp. S150]
MDQGGHEGLVNISDRVISAIIGYVVMDTPGIAGMSGSSVTGNLAKRLGGKIGTKGMSLEVSEEDVAVHLQIIVDYGCRIHEVCVNLQHNVRSAVENMLGLSLAVVNVRVDKLVLPQQ